MINVSYKQMMRSMLLALCITFTAFNLQSAAAEASDIHEHWAEAQITKWIEQGLIEGYEDGSFKPDQPVTRAEFVALVNRSFGFDQAGDVPFQDMNEEHWAYADVAIAVQSGYITGYDDGTFDPGRAISRQEVAVIAAKLLQASSDSTTEADFSDYGDIAEWAEEAVNLAYEHGLLTGYSEDRTFRPAQPMTRAEAVVTLDRVLDARTIVYDTQGTYGPEQSVETVYYDVVIRAPGVTLRNMVIHGNLTLAEEIGEGDAFLNNVTVHGETFVYGGGENSIYVADSVLVSMTVDKKTGGIRIVVEGKSTVTEVLVNTPVTIDANEALAAISHVRLSEHLPEGSTVILSGAFENVEVASSEISIEIPAGSIENFVADEMSTGMTLNLGEEAKVVSMVLDAVAKVIGEGTIMKVTMSEKAREESTIEVEAEEVVYSGDNANPPAPPVPTTPTTPTAISITNVIISGQYMTGETITAAPVPSGATASYQWQRSDDENGTYTNIVGAAAKTYQISEEDEGKWIRVRVVGTGNYAGTWMSTAQQVEAKPPEVIEASAVHVTPATLTMTVGDTDILTATIEPADATHQKVTWISSDEQVVTVNDNGAVTAIAAGSATITAIYDSDPTLTAASEISVISAHANVTAQDFGVFSNVTGYSVGFRLDDASAADVEQVVIVLYKDTMELARVTSGNVLDNYPAHTSLSAPLDVLGTFDYENDEGGNWIYTGWKGYTSDIPDRAEVTVTFKNGSVKTAINENLTGDTSIFDAGSILKTAYWGTPYNALYYFDFKLGNGHTIGNLASLEARAYDGERLLSTIQLKEDSFTKYASHSTLGGSFRSNPDASPSSSWNLQAFDGTMPTHIFVEYRTKDGKTYRTGIRDVEWKNEGFKRIVNTNLNVGYDSIQEASDAAQTGDNTIEVFPGDYGADSIAIVQREGVNIALVAVGNVVLKNQIKIDGDGRSDGTESLVIKGFTFDFSDSESASIISAQKGELGSDKHNYAHNIVIGDTTFIGNPSADIVAIKTTTGSTFGLHIVNCTGINLHSLGQLAVAEGFIVENCTVTGGESGINYYGDGDAVITNLTVFGSQYGVRAGQSSGNVNDKGSLTISASHLSAKYPVWLRANAPESVTVAGTTLIAIEDGEEIFDQTNEGSKITMMP